MPTGIITKGIGGFYYVKTPEGLYECKARGVFRKEDMAPLPGDRVTISVIDEAKKVGSLDEILPRDNQLVRPAVANVGQVAVVVAVKSPSLDLVLLDKLLITACLKNIQVLLCINKIDLDESGQYKALAEAYQKANYTVIPLSSKQDIGFDLLSEALNGKSTVFAGQSGVGKSTLLNRIMNSWVMQTGELSGKIERGKHTTRHAELVELEFGEYIVDTPGFSSFELTDIRHEELELYYPEFEEHLNKCKFTGCSHISEPCCRIKEAVASGDIDEQRYMRYIDFYTALKQNKDYSTKNNRNKK